MEHARVEHGAIAPPPRLLVGVALFGAGIVLGRALPGGAAAWFGAALGAALVGGVARGWACRLALGASVLAFGAGWFGLRVAERPSDDLAHVAGATPRLAVVEGVVDRPPIERSRQRGALAAFAHFDPRATRLVLNASAVGDGERDRDASGRVWVRVDGPLAGVGVGDRIRVAGYLSGLRPPDNPGAPDVRLAAAQLGVSARLTAPNASLVEVVEPARRGVLGAVLDGARAARARVAAALTPIDGDAHSDGKLLMGALLLGERPPEMRELNDSFAAVGLAHLLAISGLHVGLLAWMVHAGVGLTGDRPRLTAVLVLGAAGLLALAVPARAPIVRAVIMLAAFVGPACFGRRYASMTALALAAFVVLLWRPLDLFGAGFQLSFGVVAGLILLQRRLRTRLFGPPTRRDERTAFGAARDWLAGACAASVCAWGVAAPLVAHHVGWVSPAGPLLSIASIPVVAALLAGGVVSAIGLALGLGVGGAIAGPLIVAAGWASASVEWLEGAPGAAFRIGPISAPLTAAATGAIVWWMAAGSFRRPAGVGGTLGVVVWAVLTLGGADPPRAVGLRWDALAVGDGSCHLLRSGRDAVLFDCGSGYYGIGERTIPDALRALGAVRVPTVIVTHPDSDHFSGLLDAAGRLGVRRVLTTERFLDVASGSPGGPERFVVERLRADGVEVRTLRAGDRFTLGRGVVDVLWPPAGAEFASDNDASLVVLISVPTEAGVRRVLMTGDIEQAAMDGVRARAPGLRADAMEAPHHGSARPFAMSFVEAVGPRVVVQSTGPSRVGDTRWDDVRRGRAWITTARDGAAQVDLRLDGTIAWRSMQGGGHWTGEGSP